MVNIYYPYPKTFAASSAKIESAETLSSTKAGKVVPKNYPSKV
jgi:hypothetical protein